MHRLLWRLAAQALNHVGFVCSFVTLHIFIPATPTLTNLTHPCVYPITGVNTFCPTYHS